MRYKISFDKLVNRLVPYYLGGRRLILYLQSLVGPLQSVNAAFVEYAKKTRIEASMTSQVFMFEWYLNKLFSKYFADPKQRITITNGGVTIGTVVHNENAPDIAPSEQFKLYYQEGEGNEGTGVLRNLYEQSEEVRCSFVVNTPAIRHDALIAESVQTGRPVADQIAISETKYLAMLRAVIERYRLAGKTYIIKFNS